MRWIRKALLEAAVLTLCLAGCERSSAPPPGPPPPAFTTPAAEIAAVATPGDPAPSIELGQGLDGVSEALREVCHQGTVTTLQDSSASASTESSWIDAALDPDGKVGFGVERLAGAGPVGQFLRRETYAPLSDVATVPIFMLTSGTDLLEVGWPPALLVPTDDPGFVSRCGDRFVRARSHGGQLFLLVRRDWLDEAAFGAWFQAVPDFARANSPLEMLEPPEAFIPLAGRMAIHVEVLQRGGEPERLSRRLRPAGSGEVAWSWSRDCGAEDVRPCRDFIEQVFLYGFDAGAEGFGQGVAGRPADLTRVLASWDMIGGPAARLPPDSVTAARVQLRLAHATQVGVAERYRLLSARLLEVPPALEARLAGVASRLVTNLAALAAAARACREELLDPGDPAQLARCVDGATPEGLAAAGFDPTLSVAELTP